MKHVAIELNDASIALAREGQVVAAEPGFAAADPGGLVFGEAARRASRVRPHHANSRYLSELSTSPLPRPLHDARSAADLAHAHLQRLWEAHAGSGDRAILVVPGAMDREQLALLLGIAESSGVPVAGVVDAAAAASDRDTPGFDSVHLEAGLHAVGITRLESLEGVGAGHFEVVVEEGFVALHERWARRIGAAFVAQTRLDPFSEGGLEQRFFDALPAWLEALGRHAAAELDFEAGGVVRTARVERRALLEEAEPVYARIAEAVDAARRPGHGLAVRLGAVLGGLPGLAQRLTALRAVRVLPLRPGAGALGALASAGEVVSPGRLTRVRLLPWREAPVQLPPLLPAEREGPARPVTHLLVRGVAHPVPPHGLGVRVDADGQLHPTGRAEEASFVLHPVEAGLRLVGLRDEPLLRNGERLDAAGLLAVGDRLSSARGPEAVQAICVLSGAEAPRGA